MSSHLERLGRQGGHAAYYVIYNYPDDRIAYHLTSRDGIHDWTDQGLAFDPRDGQKIFTNSDGSVYRWYNVERPNVIMENGHVAYFTFAVSDVFKMGISGNSNNNTKVVVVAFDGVKFDEETGIGGADGGVSGPDGGGGSGGTGGASGSGGMAGGAGGSAGRGGAGGTASGGAGSGGGGAVVVQKSGNRLRLVSAVLHHQAGYAEQVGHIGNPRALPFLLRMQIEREGQSSSIPLSEHHSPFFAGTRTATWRASAGKSAGLPWSRINQAMSPSGPAMKPSSEQPR